jgi:hypothetical protein
VKNLGALVCAIFAIPLGLFAQTADDTAKRLQAMEKRIQGLESEVQTLKAALTAAQPTAPAPPAAAPTPPEQPAMPPPAPLSTTGALASSSEASARLMNPAISAIGNFLGAAGRNPIDPRPSLEMAESEVAFSAAVDPYARADFFLSFGEQGVELEEGFITFTSLPAGFLVKAGRMRGQFGKVNTLHRHVVPWVDRPLMTQYLVGGEDGIRDSGFSVSHLLPSPRGLFLEGTAELFRGDSEGIFAARRRSDVSLVTHLRSYRDLSESTNVEIGASFARGHNGLPTLNLNEYLVSQLYGVDGTIRWKPLRRSIYHSFVGRTELAWHHRREPQGLRKAFGYYASGEYQFRRRWFIGGRFDQADRIFCPPGASYTGGTPCADAAPIVPIGGSIRDTSGSAVLTYWPSEFSQIRGQYRHSRYFDRITANELLFQIQFSVGAHGAHPF